MIIGLSGYAKSGKDTAAEMILDLTKVQVPGLMTSNTWEIKKFSGKLKQIASILTGIEVEKFEDQRYKLSTIGSEWDTEHTAFGDEFVIEPMTVREFLQLLGTDAIRNGLHENAWVNALMAEYIRPLIVSTDERLPGTQFGELGQYPNWIVTDVRFPNEAEAIKERDGIIVRIDRPGVKPVNSHPSETALDNWDFDYILPNDSDLTYLKESVESFLKHKI